MRNYIIKITVLISAILVFNSCSESLLDIEQKGVTTQDNFYKTDEEALQGVVAAYQQMQIYNFLTKLCLSDDVYTGGGARADQVTFEELNEFTFGASNVAISAAFKQYYHSIYLANKVVDLTDDTSSERKKIIAEAKAIRAFYYFDLVTLWGDVPLVLHELDASEYSQEAVPASEIWNQIETDLKEAIEVLPLKSQQSEAAVFRFSKGAAQSLLGKAYLFQKKYNEAASMFENIINSKEYGLIGDYSRILRADSEFGSESILEAPHTAQFWATTTSPNSAFYTFALLGPRGGFFLPGNTGLLAGWGFANPTPSIYQAFMDAGDEIRRKSSIMTEAEINELGGSLRNTSGDLPYANVGSIRLKYGSWADETTLPLDKFSYGTDFRLIRYADVLLMAAEANNRNGNDGKALQYLNEVRARVSLPGLSVTGDELFDKIKKERRLELAFEGQRFQDLVRWGDAPALLVNQGKQIPRGNGQYYDISDAGFKSYNVLLPIPENELRVNSNLSQNTGY